MPSGSRWPECAVARAAAAGSVDDASRSWGRAAPARRTYRRPWARVMPGQLERLVARKSFADEPQKGVTDLDLNRRDRLLCHRERLEPPTDQTSGLLEAGPSGDADRTALIQPLDQPSDASGRLPAPRPKRLRCLDSHVRLAFVVPATNCKHVNSREWTGQRLTPAENFLPWLTEGLRGRSHSAWLGCHTPCTL